MNGCIKTYKNLEKKYDFVGFIIEGLITVKLNNKWGYVNKKEEETIPLIYDDAWCFNEGLARIKLNGRWGFINKKGEEVIPCKYEYAQEFIHGLCRVRLNNKYGFINREGKEAVPIKYDYIWTYFNDGLTRVKSNGKWGFVDVKNLPIINEFTNYISNIGSRGDTLYYARYNDSYILSTGCFIGDLEEFEKRVIDEDYKETHPFSYRKYIKVIEDLKKGSEIL